MTTSLVAFALTEPFSKLIVIVHVPVDNESIGTLKPAQVLVLGSAWTVAVALYVFPEGPLMDNEHVPLEETVWMSARIYSVPES